MFCPIGVHMNIISCAERRFIVYSVKNIDEGIEILSGKEAGALQPDGTYLEETNNFLVDRKLNTSTVVSSPSKDACIYLCVSIIVEADI